MADSSKQPDALLAAHATLVASLYAESGGARWGLDLDCFQTALARCILKAVPPSADPSAVSALLGTLHLEDLVLCCACSEGSEPAWEHFIATYRGYLRSTAAVILRCPNGSPQAVELADSLFSDLYGIADGKPGHGSLLRYFHGRSSLKTWLRAVLAQRHIDRIRAARRFTDLPDGEVTAVAERSTPVSPHPPDPYRDRYLCLLRRALTAAVAALDPRDAERLNLYYREEKTLADIGRTLGEHESSVSRNLERVRRSVRSAVESFLRQGSAVSNGSAGEPGLSDAEISVCFEYAAEDTGLNLDSLFPPPTAPQPPVPGRAPARKRP
jgi:RNA polymerase sigma factor (sigma-70 family)